MALFDYTNPYRFRKRKPDDSVLRVSYQQIGKSYKNIFFNLPPEFQYVVRFTFITKDHENAIKARNEHLRHIINKKARNNHIPMSGARFITIQDYKVIYNIVTDKLLSAIWLFTQLADIEHIRQFSWLKRDFNKKSDPVERSECFNRCKQNLFTEIKRIFEENKGVTMVEVDCLTLHIGNTGFEHLDFDPQRLSPFYGNKPRYRAKQYFGNLSGNYQPKLKQC